MATSSSAEVQIPALRVGGHQYHRAVGRNVRAEVELLAIVWREVCLLSARDIYDIDLAGVESDAGAVCVQNSVIGTEGDYIPGLPRILFFG